MKDLVSGWYNLDSVGLFKQIYNKVNDDLKKKLNKKTKNNW